MAATAGTFDFQRPFTYVFEDPAWIGKVVIGGLVILGSILTLPLLLAGLIGFMLLSGYIRRVAVGVADGAEVPLPELFAQPGEDIVVGLKGALIGFVWILPAFVLRIIGFVLMMVIQAAGGGNDDAAAAGGMVMIATTCLALPLQLLGTAIGLVGVIRFWDTGELGAGFRLGEIWAFLKRSWVNLLLGFVVMMAGAIAAEFVGVLLLCIGLLFTMFWSQLVSAHAFGQIIRLDRAARGNG